MDLKDDILASWSNEKLIDIHVVGTDGVEIPASKFVLATRSKVFETMFYSGFREQQDSRTNLGYHSKVLQLVVKYCYSDTLGWDLPCLDDDLDYSRFLDKEVTLLLQLRDAGRFFDLDAILQTVEGSICTLVASDDSKMTDELGLICRLLGIMMLDYEEEEGPFWDKLFGYVVNDPERYLQLDRGLIDCHPRLLTRVLEAVNDTNVVARCLYCWSLQEEEGNSACPDEDREALLSIAASIDLKQLSPKQLSSIGDCLAFSKDRMLEAYAHHGRLSSQQGTNQKAPLVGRKKPRRM